MAAESSSVAPDVSTEANSQSSSSQSVLQLAAFLDKELTVHNTKSDDGPEFQSLGAFWQAEQPTLSTWYKRGDEYWSVSFLYSLRCGLY